MLCSFSSLFLLLTLGGLAGDEASSPPADDPAWAAPPLEHAVSIRDGHTGARVSLAAMMESLAEADVVFVGETHIDETTHRVELAVYEAMLAAREGKVVLAMEMFERDVQPVLDRYTAGEIDEPAFLAGARPWGNYRTAYRPMIERARAGGLPVVASNFPRPLLRRFSGPESRAELSEEEQGWIPKEVLPNRPEYWVRVDNAVRGHLMMMGPRDDASRLYSTQCLWDNAMGEACADALADRPGWSVVHVNGGFHSAYWDGTVHQCRLRGPELDVKTIDVVPSSHPAVGELHGRPRADFVVYAEARAEDINDGEYSVSVSRSVDYRLHVPATATPEAPVPLLIWLSDDGLQTDDVLALWRARVGEEAAIAVLEAPYRAVQSDLGEGGRWYWPDSFASDVGALQTAVERVWGFVLRHQPVDPARVCVAGHGTGATVVAAVSLFSDMDHHAVALHPRQYAKIKDFSLPLPQFRGDGPAPRKSLLVLGGETPRGWWEDELAEYRKVEFDAEWQDATDDPWQVERQHLALVREGLGLEAAPAGAGRQHLVVRAESPRAMHWARLLAQRAAADTGDAVAILREAPSTDAGSTWIPTELDPASLAKGGIPRCPGAFGGTTVLVLPPDLPQAQHADWFALEENDPLNRISRFHRVRIATTEGEHALPAVLASLRESNRKNVLIIPATFCADGDLMRRLVAAARPEEDAMTLQWSPGLGASIRPDGEE